MMLDQVRRGQRVNIVAITDDKVRVQAIRFGINEGVIVACAETIPGGPVILVLNNQEIAIGRRMAGKIRIKPTPAGETCLTGGIRHAVS